MTDVLTIPDELARRIARLINEAEDMRAQAVDDLKTIYGDLREELKALGWAGQNVSKEVAALKGAIAEIRLDEEMRAKREEKGDRVDDYVSILSKSPARARARVRENIEKFDPDTGEIIDGSVDAKLVQTIAAGVQTETGRKALIAAVDIMIEREEAQERRSGGGLNIITKHTEIATATQGEIEAHSDDGNAGANAGGDDVDSSAERAGPEGPSSIEPTGPVAERATHSPETANEMDRSTKSSFAARSGEVENARKAVPETEHGSVTHAEAGESPAPSVLTNPPSPLRPNCRNPGEACGGYGDVHCHACKQSMRAQERAA